MSKAMDNIKEELKTLYPDENLTNEELNKMAERLVQFFELGMKFFLKKGKLIKKHHIFACILYARVIYYKNYMY